MAIDEVQLAPELLRAIKSAVDDDRRPARFLLTDSANLLWGDDSEFADLGSPLHRDEYLEIICAGSLPEARVRDGTRRRAWFDNYLSRVLDRDARELSRLAHLDRLPALLRLLAANNSGELVKTKVGAQVGIAETSLPGYLNLLETLYLIHQIPAWNESLTRRLVGQAKVALLDTGLAAGLGNLSPAAMAPGRSGVLAAGGLVESFVTAEIRRQQSWSETMFDLFHFRDRNGVEVDLVLESAEGQVAGIEVKASASVTAGHVKGLQFLRDRLGDRFTLGALLYTGRDAVRMSDRIWALPLSALWA
jgi:predicted AAA+ superfamily ATPase